MIIWIVSYPKSGNTLVRSMLSGLMSAKLYGSNGSIDFTKLSIIPEFIQNYYFKNVEAGALTNFSKLSKYWIKSQEEINSNKKINFLKTHHIRCSINGNNFTDSKNTAGVIYIVRDPRNVITSLKNYYGYDDDKAMDVMLSENWYLYPIKEQSERIIHTLVGSWPNHYKSWTRNNKRLLLVKYEDLINDKKKELTKIISYIKKIIPFDITQEEIQNCVNSSNFENMKKMENEGKFTEGSWMQEKKSVGNFFNLGEKNDWKKILNKEIREKIEFEFSEEMKELGYLY